MRGRYRAAFAGRHQAAAIEVTAIRSRFRRLTIINGLVAGMRTDRMRMLLFNILRDKADLLMLLAFVIVRIYLLAVESFADGFDVFFEPFVGKEATGLAGGGSRTRQRASSFGDVRQELRRLERVGLLLEELVVQRGLTGLLRLLRGLTGGKLGLRALQSSALSSSAKTGKSLRSTSAHAVKLLPQRSLLLGRARALRVLLLSQAAKTRSRAAVQTRQTLTGLSQAGQIGLLRAKIDALLLLGG